MLGWPAAHLILRNTLLFTRLLPLRAVDPKIFCSCGRATLSVPRDSSWAALMGVYLWAILSLFLTQALDPLGFRYAASDSAANAFPFI